MTGSNQDWHSFDQEQLSHLWDEYKYRHGLCWQAVYKVIAAVLFLAGLPYVEPELTNDLGWFVLTPPILGTMFAVFGVYVVNNELKLFSYAKVAHNQLQVRFIKSVIPRSPYRAMDTIRYLCACAADHAVYPERW